MRPGRVAKDRVALVRQRRRLAHGLDLDLHLRHQEVFDDGRALGDAQILLAMQQPVGQQMVGRGGDVVITGTRQLSARFRHERRREQSLAASFQPRPLAFRRIVEQQRDRAVLAHERDALTFLNAEIRCVAQMIGVPVVAEEHENLNVLLGHRLFQGACARLQRCGAHMLALQP